MRLCLVRIIIEVSHSENHGISQLSSPAFAVFACGMENNGPPERAVPPSREPGNMLLLHKRNLAGVSLTGS